MSRKQKEEITSLRKITKKGLRELCKKNKLYQTPELNDVLYLHYQGFQDIECLEEYTGLKCLWLESNAISDIKGLENQTQLKCLFLHNNLIRKIENLESCRELDTLNLSNNHISRIENCGVDKLPVLTTLNLAHNYLKCIEDLQNLTECKQLSVLDLANNRIEDILIVKILAEMPELRVLVLTGNPVVSRIPQYRKTLILECKELTYLDSRPVFPRDRACAEAWKRGGYEEERREHDKWNKADRKKIRDSVNATLRLRNRGGGDPQVELIGSSSDEDQGFTERTSAPLKEDLPNTRTEEFNAEISELMRLGDLVEYEQNEKCTKESVNNEQDDEIEELKCNPCIINQTKALPENKEDTAVEENSEALERYGKTYKQAYDNYLEYVQILMNQDHSTISSDQCKNNEDTAEFKAENMDNCQNKMNIKENDDNEISEPNLKVSTLNDDQISSLTELTEEDTSNLEVNKDSGEIHFTDIESKDNAPTAECGSEKIENITNSETELNKSQKVRNELLLESSDSTNLQFARDKEISNFKEEVSTPPMSFMESYLSLNSQTNNLSMPSFMFPKIIEDNESQFAPVSDVESDKIEESPRESHDGECKKEHRTIKEFISNYGEFLDTIDYNRKSHEKKETNGEKLDQVDVEKSSNDFADVDSSNTFKNIRFFVQDCPEIETDESKKLQIINRLLKNPITKQISNKKTLEELDEQLKHIQEEQTKWIKKVTDKCYSQRDRYNDDLEVRNDKLFIIKNDRNNANDKVGKEGFNDTNDEVDNTQPQGFRPISKLIKIEEGLQNDDSEVYEMTASFVCEENPSERIEKKEPNDIIKRNENYSKSDSTEHNNYSRRDSLTSMGEYLECEPFNFSNNYFLNNSERLSESNSIEDYFVPPTGSPEKDQLTDINTGIFSTLENTSEAMWECNLSEVNSEKKLKCNLSEKETEVRDDSPEIPSTSKASLRNPELPLEEEEERHYEYDNVGILSDLEISEEERQCNSFEKKTELHDFTEIPSTSKVCLEKKRKYNFSEKDKDLHYNFIEGLSILEATSEEDEKFYISKKENDGEEGSSEEGQQLNLPTEEIDLQYDDSSSNSNVKGFGSIFEKFEWIKSSILTLASNGMAEGSGDMQTNEKYVYSTDPEIDKIHRDIDEDFHKDLTSLFINASLEYKMIESAEKYGDPEVDSAFDIEQRAQWYLEEVKNHLPPEMKELISNENKNWHRFDGDVDEFKKSNNIAESPHIKKLHEILKSRNATPGALDKNKALLKLVLANKNHLLNHKNPEARELAQKILKDNGIEEPDTDTASIEVNLSNTSTEVVEEKLAI